jgi:hypothetical protein
MSRSTLYGFAPNSWHPGPDFRATRDERGLTTATQTFRCAKGDFGNPIIQLAFAKGSPIKSLYPQVEDTYANLLVDAVEATDIPGGMTEIAVTFVGRTPTTQEFGVEDEREITYTRNSGLQTRPIIEHPKFIKDTEEVPQERAAIILAYEGKAFQAKYTDAESNIEVVDGVDKVITNITTPRGVFWWKRIILDGWREYEAITSEFTKSGTNDGLLKFSGLKDLGRLNKPPKDPATPRGYIWRLTGATESTSSVDATSYSLTWTMIEDTPKNRELYTADPA